MTRVAAWVRKFRGPDKLKRRLLAGEPIVVIGRFSSPSGRKATEYAVQDLLGAVKSLRKLGIDLRGLLPSSTELTAMLQGAPSRKSFEPNGRPFSNKFVIIDLVAEHQVCFVLSTGSGHKIDEDGLQPFVTELSAQIRRTKPALVFGRRLDRYTRHAWALGPAMISLENCQGWIGDSKFGLLQGKGPESLLIFFAAKSGQDTAEVIPLQSVDGMRAKSGKKLIDGRCNFGISQPVPPGFAKIRLRDGSGLGRTIIVLDQPGCLPSKDEAAYGLPDIVDENGDPVDQVANVRFALSHLGLPGWNVQRVAAALVARGFSTDRLRNIHGDVSITAAVQLSDTQDTSSRVLRSILQNLDVYRTGVLRVELGHGAGKLTVKNLFPLDGTWASPEDFARIDRYRKQQKAKENGSVRMTFVGLRVRIDGQPAVLSAWKTSSRANGLEYAAHHADGYPQHPQRVTKAFKVTHAQVATAIVDAVRRGGDLGLRLVPLDTSDIDEQLRTLRYKIRQAEATRDAILAEQAGIQRRVLEQNEDGTAVLIGPLLDDLNERYRRLSVDLQPVLASIEKADRDITDLMERHRDASQAMQAEQLLEILATLKDPTDRTYRDLWMQSLRNIEFHRRFVDAQRSSRSSGGSRELCEFELRGDLIVADGTDRLASELRASWRTPQLEALEASIDKTLDLMAAGMPLRSQDLRPYEKYVRHQVAQRLERKPHRYWVGWCEDPRIVKAAMLAVHGRPELDAAEVAEQLGEPVEFVLRLRKLYGTSRQSGLWFGRPKTLVSEMFALAADGDGLVRFADIVPGLLSTKRDVSLRLRQAGISHLWESVRNIGYRLKPRCDCSAQRTLLLVPRLREIDTYVCSGCHKDASGVSWPADPYDRYLIFPSSRAAPANRPLGASGHEQDARSDSQAFRG